MTKYEKALEAMRRAEWEAMACLLEECMPEGTPVTDKNGKFLTKQEVIAKIRRGDKV